MKILICPYYCSQGQTLNTYSITQNNESRRMSEPCRSISKPADSPQPPRSQSAALPPMPNMNQNNGVMDNLQVDAAAEEILQFINQVNISYIFTNE